MLRSLQVFVPKNVLSREDLDPVQRANFERITGIKKTRRWEGTTHSFLEAGLALAAPKLEPRKIGSVIVVTQSPDRLSPCMAVEVQRQLGLDKDIPVFDANQSCDGFIYGLWLASRLSIRFRDVLLVCIDRLRFTGNTPVESFIFSDAMSVAVVPDFLRLHCEFLNQPDGAKELYSMIDGKMEMQGGAVHDFVTGNIPGFIKRSLGHLSDEFFLCQHQANLSMMKIVERRAGIIEKFSLRSIEEYGNQSMVSIPTALVMNEEKILGQSVLLCGYGAGFSAATCSMHWPSDKIGSLEEI